MNVVKDCFRTKLNLKKRAMNKHQLSLLFCNFMYEVYSYKTYIFFGLFALLALGSALEYAFGIKTRKIAFTFVTSAYLILAFISLATHFIFMARTGYKIEPYHVLHAQQIIVFIILIAGSHEFYRDFFEHDSKFNFVFNIQRLWGFQIWTPPAHCQGKLEIKQIIAFIKFKLFLGVVLLFTFFMDSDLVWNWLYVALYYKKFTLLGTFLVKVFY